MKLVSFFLLGLFLSCSSMEGLKNDTRTGILILGSDHIPTLNERINSGFELYKSLEKVEYIIVSGGCNAHDSGFCEASEMKELLVAKGVSKNMVFKEEKSKSTFQNYCFSRSLKNNKGENLIRKNDFLYVVSNHWHAIPVAARFREYDSVHASYYIVGEITPELSDSVNYGNIYSKEKSDCICQKNI